MAENLHDGEFWLPPQFLAAAADDVVTEKADAYFNKAKNGDAHAFGALFPSEFPYGFMCSGIASGLSSPVESLVGSSETESDEEEHMAELTRRMAHSTLDSDLDHDFGFEKSKGAFVSGSPQSTLCGFGSGCGCRKGSSSHGSPNSACQLSSSRATWDLLHAAAGEMERMKIKEDGYGYFNNHRGGLLGGPTRKPSPVENTYPDVGFYAQQSLSHQQLRIAQFQMLKQQQMAKAASGSGFYLQRQSKQQMVPNRGRNNARPAGLSSSAWPSLQQQQQQFGSGMRAVFLDNPSGKRECAGTGVFLPRRVDNPAESRRKPACSTVLVPARVMQALNLKVEDMIGGQGQYQPRFNGSSTMENDSHVNHRLRSGQNHSQQRRCYLRSQQHPPLNHEIRLPQEWTYRSD
ncbi:TIP41-like protein [Senna tora]|uniref:TIP41-like protein n=1 Tax=Senna tora TaxID=362788 RepID=A0A834XHN9_9FABA|nr:TIP41-like protein [Senna tora]